jgi:hypothetical protein
MAQAVEAPAKKPFRQWWKPDLPVAPGDVGGDVAAMSVDAFEGAIAQMREAGNTPSEFATFSRIRVFRRERAAV